MNDFAAIVLAFGRGIIKVLISGLTGFGVGLLVVGITTASKPQIWHQGGGPPGELLIGIGAGLLSGGGTLLALFFVPFFTKRASRQAYVEEAPILARPAPRPPRRELEEPPAPPKPRLELDDSSVPIARPAPPPVEPRDGGFFEKG